MAKLDSPQAITRRAALVLGLAGAVGAGALALARRGPRTPDHMGDFDLPALPELKGPNGFPMKGFGAKDLAGHMSMVTLFASWRPECRAEHDRLIDLAARVRSPVFGALSLDKAAAGVRFLSARGNPFRAVGDDSRALSPARLERRRPRLLRRRAGPAHRALLPRRDFRARDQGRDHPVARQGLTPRSDRRPPHETTATPLWIFSACVDVTPASRTPCVRSVVDVSQSPPLTIVCMRAPPFSVTST